jgi:hypothetical protein
VALVAAVLDERIAQRELFEDVLLFGLEDDEQVDAVDSRPRIRRFLPFRVDRSSRGGLASLALLSQRHGQRIAVPARWYLAGVQLGPTPDAIVFLWIAIEGLVGDGSKLGATKAALQAAGASDEFIDSLQLRSLIRLRGHVVHKGDEDPANLASGFYRLESVARILLRHELGVITSWPPSPGDFRLTARFTTRSPHSSMPIAGKGLCPSRFADGGEVTFR